MCTHKYRHAQQATTQEQKHTHTHTPCMEGVANPTPHTPNRVCMELRRATNSALLLTLGLERAPSTRTTRYRFLKRTMRLSLATQTQNFQLIHFCWYRNTSIYTRALYIWLRPHRHYLGKRERVCVCVCVCVCVHKSLSGGVFNTRVPVCFGVRMVVALFRGLGPLMAASVAVSAAWGGVRSVEAQAAATPPSYQYIIVGAGA